MDSQNREKSVARSENYGDTKLFVVAYARARRADRTVKINIGKAYSLSHKRHRAGTQVVLIRKFHQLSPDLSSSPI